MSNLKKEALDLNIALGNTNLVNLTFGNASIINKERTEVYIKPSGVNYSDMREKDISVIDIDKHDLIDGLKASVDLDIHLEIYKNFTGINSIIHTHSKFATIFAQSGKEIPISGTTHADYFKNNIPITNELSSDEILSNYELNIGKKIVSLYSESFKPEDTPAALIANHGCVVFGKSDKDCLENAIVLEYIAELAFFTDQNELNKNAKTLYEFHHRRKHGEDKYNGQ